MNDGRLGGSRDFDVFLSHCSVDKPWVLALKEALESCGLTVWVDRDEIRPGDLFAKALEAGLYSSRSVALIVSPDAMNSGWVEEEYYRALSLTKKESPLQLIPVLLRDAELPGFLSDRNWVDFRDEDQFSASLELLVWGITGRKQSRQSESSSGSAGGTPVRVPDFEFEDLVRGDDFIDREQELKRALGLIRHGKRFLIVGKPRVGKTCFCERLIELLHGSPDKDILATRLDLEAMQPLTPDTFYGHTLLEMLAQIVRILFGGTYSDLKERSPQLPERTIADPEFQRLRSVFRTIRSQIFLGRDESPSPLQVKEFEQHTKDLLSIIRAKGGKRFVVFYDEANKLSPDLSIELLAANAKGLAVSHFISIFVASDEMAEALHGRDTSLGTEFPMGPFEAPIHMRRLLSRYYFGDTSHVDRLPISDKALDVVWEVSGGSPFLLQHLFAKCFRLANQYRDARVSVEHVNAAVQLLEVTKPQHFGRQGPMPRTSEENP